MDKGDREPRAGFRDRLGGAYRNPHNRATVFAVVLTFAVLALNVFAVWVSTKIRLDAKTSRTGITNVSVVTLIVGAVLMTVLLGFFLYIGLDDYFRDRRISIFYGPMTATKATVVLQVTLTAAQGIDFFVNRQPKMLALYEPEVRIWQNATLILVFASFGWMLFVVMRGRGYRLRNVVALYVAIAATCMFIVFTAILNR